MRYLALFAGLAAIAYVHHSVFTDPGSWSMEGGVVSDPRVALGIFDAIFILPFVLIAMFRRKPE